MESFSGKPANAAPGGLRMGNISDKLVELIERNADSLANAWIREIKKSRRTPTFAKFDDAELFKRAVPIYSRLGRWISRETTREPIARQYLALGRQWAREGFALSEVIEALVIARRLLWLKVLSEGLLDTALELLKALELNNRTVYFFDRAMYYTGVGFEQETAGVPAGAPAPDGCGGA